MTMTIQETSKYLGLNEYTTYRLVKDGKIPAKKNDEGKWLVCRNNIESLFEFALKTHNSKN